MKDRTIINVCLFIIFALVLILSTILSIFGEGNGGAVALMFLSVIGVALGFITNNSA